MCTARHHASALISCIISWYQHEYSENKTDLNCFSSELILLLAWSGECRKWILMRQFIWSDILIRISAGISDPVDSVYTLTDPPPPLPFPQINDCSLTYFLLVPFKLTIYTKEHTVIVLPWNLYFNFCLNNRLFYDLFIYQNFFSPGFYITQKVMNPITQQRVKMFKIKQKTKNKQTWVSFQQNKAYKV